MSWQTVLDQAAHMGLRLQDDRAYYLTVRAFLLRVMRDTGHLMPSEDDPFVHLYWTQPILMGAPIVVERRIGDFLDIAAQSLPANAIVDVAGLPSVRGCVLFEQPYFDSPPDDPNPYMPWVGATWMLARYDEANLHYADLTSVEQITGDTQLHLGLIYADPHRGWIPGGIYIMRNGINIDGVNYGPQDAQTPFDVPASRRKFRVRLMVTLLAFLRQRILSYSATRVDRHSRHRLGKMGYEPPEEIRTVILRRMEHHATVPGDHRDVDWQWQWWVRGFWRQQWYPSQQVHRPRWVGSYLKGPEGRPIKPPPAEVFIARR